jgi:hypothetical protein
MSYRRLTPSGMVLLPTSTDQKVLTDAISSVECYETIATFCKLQRTVKQAAVTFSSVLSPGEHEKDYKNLSRYSASNRIRAE